MTTPAVQTSAPTVTLALLRRFCAPHWDVRATLINPWREGNTVVACNGFVAIRVPAEGEFSAVGRDETLAYPCISELIDQAIKASAGGTAYPVAGNLPAPITCPQCKGRHNLRPCRDCVDGVSSNGETCPYCYGEGEFPAAPGEAGAENCWACGGTGHRQDIGADLGPGYFSWGGLALIAAVGGSIHLSTPASADATLWTFAGGDGVIMPRRR